MVHSEGLKLPYPHGAGLLRRTFAPVPVGLFAVQMWIEYGLYGNQTYGRYSILRVRLLEDDI